MAYAKNSQFILNFNTPGVKEDITLNSSSKLNDKQQLETYANQWPSYNYFNYRQIRDGGSEPIIQPPIIQPPDGEENIIINPGAPPQQDSDSNTS